MNIKSLFALTVALLAGCASRTLPNQYTLDPNGNTGVVVASITHTGTFGHHTVWLQSLDDSIRERFSVGQVTPIPFPQKHDIKDDEVKGDVFSVELPRGKYKVERWSVDTQGFHVGAPATIRFTVEPGKITYLGRFEFVQTDTRGMAVLGAVVAVKDESEKDMAIVVARTPSLKNEPIAINVSASKGAQSVNTNQPQREFVAPFMFVPPAK